jgi:hypothetical protein
MDLNHILAVFAITAASVAFVIGLVITAATGSARNVKIFLAILSIILGAITVAGLIFSRGLLTYLLFQLISLVLVLYLVVVAGAVCGGGIYTLLHKKTIGLSLGKTDLAEYLPAAEFSTLEGITEERALARIKSGYYQGGRHAGAWYIHKSELSPTTIKQEVV